MIVSLVVAKLMEMDEKDGKRVASFSMYLRKKSDAYEFPTMAVFPGETVERCVARLAKTYGCFVNAEDVRYIESFVVGNELTLLFYTPPPPGPPLKREDCLWVDSDAALFALDNRQAKMMHSMRAFLNKKVNA
jgi:hypothetical protein